MRNEDNRYYTPEISEFHEGFRYEQRRQSIVTGVYSPWEPKVYCLDEEMVLGIHMYNNDCRVKCLDRRDIEELGWEHAVFGGVEEFNKPNARLNWVQETQRVIIAKWEVEWFDVVFNGTIKNFNELQKLMKQLLI